jgi:hypothetical protein
VRGSTMCGERYLVGQVVAAVLDGGDDVGGGGAIARANGEGQICSASIKLELSLIELELEVLREGKGFEPLQI